MSAVAEVKLVRVPKRVRRETRNSMLASGGGSSQWLVATNNRNSKGLARDEWWSSMVVCWLHCCSWSRVFVVVAVAE